MQIAQNPITPEMVAAAVPQYLQIPIIPLLLRWQI